MEVTDPEAPSGTASEEGGAGESKARTRLLAVLKLLLHGILLTAAVLALNLAVPLLLILPAIAGIIFLGLAGLVLVLLILYGFFFFLEGFANSFITRWLWFPVKRSLMAYLGHGIVLGLAATLLEGVPIFVALPTITSLAGNDVLLVEVALVILLIFANGAIGRAVARIWETPEHRVRRIAALTRITATPEPTEDNPRRLQCPRCHGTRLVVAADGSAYCIDCKRGQRKEFMTGSAG